MTQKKIKTGVIGVGHLGSFHADKYAEINNSDFIGVVDRDFKRAEEIAKKLGVKAFQQPEELINEVDAVSIAVPTCAHFEIGELCLNAQKHVLMEKPMAADVDQANQLVHLAQEKACHLEVGHIERHHPVMNAVKEKIKAPRFIEVHRLSPFTARSTDIDVVLDLMIHDLDLSLEMVGSPIKEIRASGVSVLTDRVDIANARLEFESGAVANLTASRVSPQRTRKFRIFQEDNYLSLDFIEGMIQEAKKVSKAGGFEVEVRQDHVGKKDHLRKEIEVFLHGVESRMSGAPPKQKGASGQAGLRALEAATKVLMQIQSSR
jgi:predicted dehydrogenase